MTIVIDLIQRKNALTRCMANATSRESFMHLLDSFRVDHTRMDAPAVRYSKKSMSTPSGDGTSTVFDLRFCVPDEEKFFQSEVFIL